MSSFSVPTKVIIRLYLSVFFENVAGATRIFVNTGQRQKLLFM